MKVREYKSEDSVGVKNLILSILEKEYPFDKSAYQDSDINDISGTYSGEGNAFFVAEKGKHIVGTIGVKQDTKDIAIVRRFFVDANFRKQGFGGALLKKAISFCHATHYKKVAFRATDRMKQAMGVLKKMGFSEKEDLEISGFHIHQFIFDLEKK